MGLSFVTQPGLVPEMDLAKFNIVETMGLFGDSTTFSDSASEPLVHTCCNVLQFTKTGERIAAAVEHVWTTRSGPTVLIRFCKRI